MKGGFIARKYPTRIHVYAMASSVAVTSALLAQIRCLVPMRIWTEADPDRTRWVHLRVVSPVFHQRIAAAKEARPICRIVQISIHVPDGDDPNLADVHLQISSDGDGCLFSTGCWPISAERERLNTALF